MRRAGSAWAWPLWLLLAVPTLVLGPLWNGGSLVVHEHSEVGEHVHVFSETGHEHHEEHAAQHALEHEEAEASLALAEPEREGAHLRIALPGPPAPPSASSASPVPSALLPLYATVVPRAPSCQTAPAISGTGPPGRACREKQRSGVAAVLTTSCAILI